MSAIVDFTFYTNVYKGNEADTTSFPALNAHASRIIGAMTRWQVDEDNISQLPLNVQNLYKYAICAQVDYLAINGVESINSGSNGGFTVGKVTVHEGSKASAGGAMSANVSPSAMLYLEQTGLLYPAVPAVEAWWP